jgi:hypothetical protein
MHRAYEHDLDEVKSDKVLMIAYCSFDLLEGIIYKILPTIIPNINYEIWGELAYAYTNIKAWKVTPVFG